MYAVLRQGNHQYRVAKGDVIQIEKINHEKGDNLEFEDVLALGGDGSVEIGQPRVADAVVRARVTRNDRCPKIVVFKYKRRKGFAKKQGHRQDFTEVLITGIFKNGQEI